MLSIINYAGIRCCESGETFSKSINTKEKVPWVDIAIGIILIVIGQLAMDGHLPLDFGKWLIVAGSFQLGIGVLFKLSNCEFMSKVCATKTKELYMDCCPACMSPPWLCDRPIFDLP